MVCKEKGQIRALFEVSEMWSQSKILGKTTSWSKIFQRARLNTKHVVLRKYLLKIFKYFWKRMLQNYVKTLKKCFLVNDSTMWITNKWFHRICHPNFLHFSRIKLLDKFEISWLSPSGKAFLKDLDLMERAYSS